MNFQQLRIVREARRRQFNLTEVARALATSQSGVSRHIKDLEDELGVALFLRQGKRLLGLTEPGHAVADLAASILDDAARIRSIAGELGGAETGELVIATTHSQARYALPRVVAQFRGAFPRVRLVLHQVTPGEVASMLAEGHADIGIATEALAARSELAAFPFFSWRHRVIVPYGHALAGSTQVDLTALARHPLITYHEGFTGRTAIDAAFAKAGLEPDIVMTALDADVIKSYVELGLGAGIVASIALDPARDQGFTVLEADMLFPENTALIAVRRGRFLRGFVYRFIEICSPALKAARLRKEIGEG